ncbi:MAG: sugar phosphorylase [Chloroflexi bacterium]|nr:sugar phosphorylase [Chloroflexota bacterium]
MSEYIEQRILDHLTFLYGVERAPALLEKLRAILTQFRQRNPQLLAAREHPSSRERLTERDIILITYGDQVTEPDKPPLQSQAEVLEKHVKGAITGVHVLPFFPYSSDDGFSVIDYTVVNPDFGTWADIERLGRNFRLMFDAVINHISAHSRWFQEFLKGNPEFADYFIVVEEGTDLSQVVRPRALPLLTRVQTAHGERLVWTTFSTDQIDPNYANPKVLLKIIEILLLYVEKGGEIIRLDAIAYLWKKIGTTCIHLEETHRVVKLFRAVLDAVAPQVILITETNVPHEENVSYFGDGADKRHPFDEAQMVYQFSLPPLVLHAFHSGVATYLSEWAAGLFTPSDSTTFFNFLASHDGIGVRPVEGILSQSEVQGLVERTLAHGGFVSYKTNSDGTQSVYELNISYFDALSDPNGSEPLDLQAHRFLASQAIMLSLAGVPGIYVHSLFGSRSYPDGVERTGRYRSINREKFQRSQLEQALADPSSLRHRVFYPYLHLIHTRSSHQAFHPNGPQQVISVHPALFVVLRSAPDESESLLCIHNVSGDEQPFQINLDALPLPHSDQVHDLIAEASFPVDGSGDLSLRVAPYQVLWLTGETA